MTAYAEGRARHSAQIDAPRPSFALWSDADMRLYRVTEIRARFRRLTREAG
jgi:hypothetical protein